MSKITSILFLLISCTAFSQTSKLVHGKVSYQGNYQKNIDVVNFTTRKFTQTNASGDFEIEAKANDVLIFMSENFADQKYKLTAEDIEKNTILITLVEKPVPLDEVEIRQIKAIKVEAVSYEGIKMAKLEKEQSNPVNKDVYTGEMPYGMDFIQIGKMVGKLFKSKKPKTEKQDPIPFKEYAKTNFNESFFSKTLKVSPTETSRFLDYCDTDPKSKTVTEGNDELAILEFLMTKKTEFDKLK
ncbi:MAG: hypothetical protein QM710_07275 [Flavobacterium sp.]